MADSRIGLKTQGRRSGGNAAEEKTLTTGQGSRTADSDDGEAMGRREREVMEATQGKPR
jgi:hypothetical protein